MQEVEVARHPVGLELCTGTVLFDLGGGRSARSVITSDAPVVALASTERASPDPPEELRPEEGPSIPFFLKHAISRESRATMALFSSSDAPAQLTSEAFSELKRFSFSFEARYTALSCRRTLSGAESAEPGARRKVGQRRPRRALGTVHGEGGGGGRAGCVGLSGLPS